MKKKDALLPAEPTPYGALLQRSLGLYFNSFKKTLGIALLLGIVVYFPRIISDLAGKNIFTGTTLFSLQQVWIAFIELPAQALFIGLIWHMYCTARHVNEPLTEDLRMGIKKLLYVFAASLLITLIVFVVCLLFFSLQKLSLSEDLLHLANTTTGWLRLAVGFLLVLESVGVIYISTLFLFFVPLIALENRGILASLKYSATLVWNHWWLTLSTQATPWIIYLFTMSLFNDYLFIFHKINTAIYHPIWWLTVIYVIIFALFVGWSAALLLTQLKDLELRNKISQQNTVRK